MARWGGGGGGEGGVLVSSRARRVLGKGLRRTEHGGSWLGGGGEVLMKMEIVGEGGKGVWVYCRDTEGWGGGVLGGGRRA